MAANILLDQIALKYIPLKSGALEDFEELKSGNSNLNDFDDYGDVDEEPFDFEDGGSEDDEELFMANAFVVGEGPLDRALLERQSIEEILTRVCKPRFAEKVGKKTIPGVKDE